MKLRLRLSTLLWLVAIVAVFLAGVQIGEDREAARWRATYTLLPPPGSGYRLTPFPNTQGTPP